MRRTGLRRARHFDFKPPRAEGGQGVWDSAAGCMRNYVIFKQQAAAFRADPRVTEALAAVGVTALSQPTLADDETLDSLVGEAIDPDELGRREVHIERLDQLFMDHLLCVA